jgi:hypothetical protein
LYPPCSRVARFFSLDERAHARQRARVPAWRERRGNVRAPVRIIKKQ